MMKGRKGQMELRKRGKDGGREGKGGHEKDKWDGK